MDVKKCPCDGCVLIAICRLKTFNTLLVECEILVTYLYRNERFTEISKSPSKDRIQKVLAILNPHWKIGFTEKGSVFVTDVIKERS